MPVSKALGRVLLRRNGGRKLVNCDKSVGGLGNFDQVRWLSGVGCVDRVPVVSDSVCSVRRDVGFSIGGGSVCSGFGQRRGFLGCGDGD